MNYQVAMSVSYHHGSGSGSSSAGAAGSNGPPGSQYRIPDELQEILLDFTVNYLIEQPSDIARFGVEYFVKLTATRSNRNEDADHSEDESMLSDEEIRRNGLNIQVITIIHTGYVRPVSCSALVDIFKILPFDSGQIIECMDPVFLPKQQINQFIKSDD